MKKKHHIALRIIFLASGHLCTALGVAGIFLPLLPTTPFLLLAVFFYARSSEKFTAWLTNHKILGSFIKDYIEGKGIPIKAKITAVTMIWLVIGASVIFFVPVLSGKIAMLAVAAGVTIYLIMLPARKIEKELSDGK